MFLYLQISYTQKHSHWPGAGVFAVEKKVLTLLPCVEVQVPVSNLLQIRHWDSAADTAPAAKWKPKNTELKGHLNQKTHCQISNYTFHSIVEVHYRFEPFPVVSGSSAALQHKTSPASLSSVPCGAGMRNEHQFPLFFVHGGGALETLGCSEGSLMVGLFPCRHPFEGFGRFGWCWKTPLGWWRRLKGGVSRDTYVGFGYEISCLGALAPLEDGSPVTPSGFDPYVDGGVCLHFRAAVWGKSKIPANPFPTHLSPEGCVPIRRSTYCPAYLHRHPALP